MELRSNPRGSRRLSRTSPQPSPGGMVFACWLTSPLAAPSPHSSSGPQQGPTAERPAASNSALPCSWSEESALRQWGAGSRVPRGSHFPTAGRKHHQGGDSASETRRRDLERQSWSPQRAGLPFGPHLPAAPPSTGPAAGGLWRAADSTLDRLHLSPRPLRAGRSQAPPLMGSLEVPPRFLSGRLIPDLSSFGTLSSLRV